MSEPLNDFTEGDIRYHMALAGGALVRYNATERQISFFQSVVLLFRCGRWVRSVRSFNPIFPGQAGYDDAIYESNTVYDRHEMERLTKIHPLI